MTYICHKCNKSFSQKGHLEKHLDKKKPCQKCNTNFMTQYAYINTNTEPIHINDYTKQKGDKIRCQYGHDLIMCNGPKIKKYFRHKNSKDTNNYPMTEWHSRMQSYFPDSYTEVILNKIGKQIKERRADVLIKNHNCIIEMEHSGKTLEQIICKAEDCKLHKMNIIWLIDGNTDDIELEELSTGNYLISFNNCWKYNSFKHTYDYILLDINDKIFKIPVKKVCNKMILVKEWKSIDSVMNILLTNPKYIWNEWIDDNEFKATLTIQQKGAGNGKTYSIWKNISLNIDKDVFIIVTKQHSAKSVILEELNEQAERNEYHIVNNLDNIEINEISRKYVIKYKHNHSERTCIVIIGTIDSLMYNLSTNSNSNLKSNYFEGLLETIKEYGLDKVNKKTGAVRYANQEIRLNKKTELWIDEAQDLNYNYFKAVVCLMYESKIDVVIVGDKLQSLEYRQNFMTCTEEGISNINIIREPAININRRIAVEKMSDEINGLINFKNYNLPQIDVPKSLMYSEKPVTIIDTPTIYSGDYSSTNQTKLQTYISDIIEYVDNDVQKYNYLPQDFLFIFPIMKSNLIATELETKLNKYWIDKRQDTNEYKNYAILHKHEEGTVIDTSLSKEASRIVTIRTSKGDGRKVVFILGCTEATLKMVSNSIDLIYESYLHVALTRAKDKIYFGLCKNNDEIHKRFGTRQLVEYMPPIKNNINLDKIIQYIDKDKVVELLKNNNIKEPEQTKTQKDKTNTSIDWEYHCIRRAIYLQYAIFNIIKKSEKNNFNKSQLKCILDNISELPICKSTPKHFFKYLNSIEKYEHLKYIPVCNFSHKEIYKNYVRKIERCIKTNIDKYKKNKLSIYNQKPIEAVLQWYIIELYSHGKYCETSPTTIYNIIDCFEKEDDTKLSALLRESEKIKEITTAALTEILDVDTSIEWNIEHMVQFGGLRKDFKIFNKGIPIIGNSKTTIYHMLFQTDFNALNFWDTMIKIIIERFILYNPGDKGKDLEKFKHKQIKTYIFILKQNRYKIFDWNWDNEDKNTRELKYIIKDAVVKYFSSFNTQCYYYCNFIKKSDKWKKGFTSPYDYIADKYKTINYMRDFFKSLDDRSKYDKKIVKNITDNENLFCEELTNKLEELCNLYFGLITHTDDEEW